MLSNVSSNIKEFFFPFGSPKNLGIFRLLFGIYLLWHIVPLFHYVPLYFSVEGFYLPLLETPINGIKSISDIFAFITAPVSVTVAYIYFAITCLCLFLFTIGLWARVAIFIFSLFWAYYYFLYMHFTNCSFDKIIMIFSLILTLSPCDEEFSLKSYFRKKSGGSAPINVPLWTQRLITLEISLMYLGTSIFKLLSGAWNGGEVIYTALMGDWTTPASFWLARQGLPLGFYDLLMISVIFFEITAWFLLYDQKYQKLWMLGGTLFHLSNAILLNVWEFMFFPLTYILFFQIKKSRDGA